MLAPRLTVATVLLSLSELTRPVGRFEMLGTIAGF